MFSVLVLICAYIYIHTYICILSILCVSAILAVLVTLSILSTLSISWSILSVLSDYVCYLHLSILCILCVYHHIRHIHIHNIILCHSMCIHVSVYMHRHIYTYIYSYIHASILTCRVHTHRVYIYTHITAYVICIYLYVYICICICIGICIGIGRYRYTCHLNTFWVHRGPNPRLGRSLGEGRKNPAAAEWTMGKYHAIDMALIFDTIYSTYIYIDIFIFYFTQLFIFYFIQNLISKYVRVSISCCEPPRTITIMKMACKPIALRMHYNIGAQTRGQTRSPRYPWIININFTHSRHPIVSSSAETGCLQREPQLDLCVTKPMSLPELLEDG